MLEYAYATSEPDSRLEKGFDSVPVDGDESAPRVSMVAYSPTVEHAHHQELSLSHRIGKNNLQIAVYTDRVSDPALTGVGEFTRTMEMFCPICTPGRLLIRETISIRKARALWCSAS